DFDTLQAIGCVGIDMDVDIAFQMVADSDMPRLVLTDGPRTPTPPNLARDRNLRHGAQLDGQGRVVDEHLARSGRQWMTLSAPEVCLSVEPAPSRPNGLRGVSAMRRGLKESRDAKGSKGCEKMAAKINWSLAGVSSTPESRSAAIAFG